MTVDPRIISRIAGTLALLALPAAGCRRRRALAPRPRAVALAPLFAGSATAATVQRFEVRAPVLSPFITTVDGSAATLTPAGQLRWIAERQGAPAVRSAQTPCRYDPSRHASYWTLSPRVALDGAGHACCVHDGDAAAPAGAYCGDLRAAQPVFSRANTTEISEGVGSGDGAIALFARDVYCTRDGGRHSVATWRGDLEQPLSVASCSAHGYVVAVGAARSFGALRLQTLRAGRADSALEPIADAPRGEPVDVRALDDGTAEALMVGADNQVFVRRETGGHVRVEVLGNGTGRSIGRWGRDTAVLAPPMTLTAVPRSGEVRRRHVEGQIEFVLAATRVGRRLVVVTRDGDIASVSTE